MKQTVLIPLIIALITALVLLWLVGGVEWLQSIYLWIAKIENSARGIDGITEASRVKVMDDAVRHFAIYRKVCKGIAIILLLLFCLDGKKRLDRMEH